MAHGIFPTHNRYYLATEIFPYLSKQEIKAVYFPDKTRKTASPRTDRFNQEEDDLSNKRKHKS